MYTQIINTEEVQIVPSSVDKIYHNLLKHEPRGGVVFETWERPDGSKYMISRKKTLEELDQDKEIMLKECLSDWKKVWG